jgi:hypothetical protein
MYDGTIDTLISALSMRKKAPKRANAQPSPERRAAAGHQIAWPSSDTPHTNLISGRLLQLDFLRRALAV